MREDVSSGTASSLVMTADWPCWVVLVFATGNVPGSSAELDVRRSLCDLLPSASESGTAW